MFPNSCISSLDIVHNMWINLALAFGNKIVLTADYVSIETTCASALPTRSQCTPKSTAFSGTPPKLVGAL